MCDLRSLLFWCLSCLPFWPFLIGSFFMIPCDFLWSTFSFLGVLITQFFSCDFSPIILIFFSAANFQVYSTYCVKNVYMYMLYIITTCNIMPAINECSLLLYTFCLSSHFGDPPVYIFVKGYFWIDLYITPPRLCL